MYHVVINLKPVDDSPVARYIVTLPSPLTNCTSVELVDCSFTGDWPRPIYVGVSNSSGNTYFVPNNSELCIAGSFEKLVGGPRVTGYKLPINGPITTFSVCLFDGSLSVLDSAVFANRKNSGALTLRFA